MGLSLAVSRNHGNPPDLCPDTQIIACIYTAIHLNVPDKTDWFGLLLRKVCWVLLALFAPELVLYTAASQFTTALNLRKELRKLQAESKTVYKSVSAQGRIKRM